MLVEIRGKFLQVIRFPHSSTQVLEIELKSSGLKASPLQQGVILLAFHHLPPPLAFVILTFSEHLGMAFCSMFSY